MLNTKRGWFKPELTDPADIRELNKTVDLQEINLDAITGYEFAKDILLATDSVEIGKIHLNKIPADPDNGKQFLVTAGTIWSNAVTTEESIKSLKSGGLDALDITRNDTQGRPLNWEQLGILDTDFNGLNIVQALTYISTKLKEGQSVYRYMHAANSVNFSLIFPETSQRKLMISRPSNFSFMMQFDISSYTGKIDGHRKFYDWGLVLVDSGFYEKANKEDLNPVGVVTAYVGATAPTGWLLCDGTSFSAITYPDLNTILGSNILPDLRGEFVRGLDNGRGVDAGRLMLEAQGDAIRNITGKITTLGNEALVQEDGVNLSTSGALGVDDAASTNLGYTAVTHGATNTIDFDASRVVPVSTENRPRNIAMNYIIRAL